MKTSRRIFYAINCLLLQLLFLTGCRDEEIVPTARFRVGYESPDYSTRLYGGKIPTYVLLKATDSSVDAVSYEWNFGDGHSAAEKEPTFRYEKSGTYTVTLTTTSRTGNKQVSTQLVTVVDRVLKRANLEYFRWDALGTLSGRSETQLGDLQLVIGQRQPADLPTQPSTILYTSEQPTSLSERNPASLPINMPIVIDPFGNINSLVVNLYAYDQGVRTLVFSSGVSGAGISGNDWPTGQYVLSTGVGGTILRLQGDYE